MNRPRLEDLDAGIIAEVEQPHALEMLRPLLIKVNGRILGEHRTSRRPAEGFLEAHHHFDGVRLASPQ
jgi:hypothetical protein